MAKSGVVAGLAPALSDAPKASLTDGTVQVTITGLQPVGSNPDDGFYATCSYPDGWTRDHQVADMAGLLPKLVNNLRARYGVESVTALTAPDLETGAIIELEVTNGI